MTTKRRTALVILLPCVVILALLVVFLRATTTDSSTAPISSTTPDITETQDASTSAPAEFDGSFSLTDQNGVRRTDSEFRGKFMLMFFGFTGCGDICPISLAVQAGALDKLGPQAKRIAAIFVSVDPLDTPDTLKSYLTSFNPKAPSARSDFIGLTGGEDSIASLARAYNVAYQAHMDIHNDAGYSYDHDGGVYLVGPGGNLMTYYAQGITADEMADDLKLKLQAQP